MKLKKGDHVVVLKGKDRGKDGVVMRVLPAQNKVIVEGVNVAKKHQRQTKVRVRGGIIDRDMPIPVSSVALVCPRDGAVRVGYESKDDGTKVRICKRCGREL